MGFGWSGRSDPPGSPCMCCSLTERLSTLPYSLDPFWSVRSVTISSHKIQVRVQKSLLVTMRETTAVETPAEINSHNRSDENPNSAGKSSVGGRIIQTGRTRNRRADRETRQN